MVCTFAAKAVGAFYRLPLTNLLGATGIGYYQLVFPIYALVLALTSSAIPVLLARQIAKETRFGYAVFYRAMRLMALVGGVGALLLLALAYPLALAQGADAMAWMYVAVAPAVLAVALSSVYRGWFAANLHTGVLAGMTLVEQVVKLSGLAFAYLLSARGTVPAVVGALLGVTLAEVGAWLWCVVAYIALGYRFGRPETVVPMRPIWRATLPITAANMIMPVVTGVDSLLLVNLSVWAGQPRTDAVSDYGLLTGAVGTLTSMPVVLTLAFVTLIVPVVSRAVQARQADTVRNRSADTLWVVFAISLPCAVGMAMLAPQLMALLYPRLTPAQHDYAAQLLPVAAVGVPILAMQQVYNALLQAVERSVTGARHMLVGGGVKLLLDVALVPLWGMMGAVVANVACYAVVGVLHYASYRHLTGRYDLGRPLWGAALGAACMAATMWSLVRLVHNNTWCVVLNILLGGGVYAIIWWCVYGAHWWQNHRADARE